MFENVYVIIKNMQEGQEVNGGLNAGWNLNGGINSENEVVSMSLDAVPSGTGDIELGGHSEENRKKKRRFIIAGCICLAFALLVGIVFVRQSGLLDKIINGDRMKNDELIEKLDQANHDLLNFTSWYNEAFTVGVDGRGGAMVVSMESFEEFEEDYAEVEKELEELPSVEKTRIKNEEKSLYTELTNEMRERFNKAKGGIELSKKFNEAFFWPIEEYYNEVGNDDARLAERKELINDERNEVAGVASILDELYQLVISGADEESLENFLNSHDDLVVNYSNCFKKVDGLNEFYDKVNEFMEDIKK